MLKATLAQFQQGHRTIQFPKTEPTMPDRFRGRPVIEREKCPVECRDCADACPTDAIVIENQDLRLDLGRCLFCTDCVEACPEQAIRYTQEFRLAANRREDLVMTGQAVELAKALENRTRRLFGRSLKLRQVSAGGCNGCESGVNVLNTIVFDLGRFGIQFVASPRHADGLLITGPVTENMKSALKDTYGAVPSPKIVIAVGACAIAGGPYINSSRSSQRCKQCCACRSVCSRLSTTPLDDS